MILARLILGLLPFIFFINLSVSAAEILQVRNSEILQIGDQNRNYTVQIACVEVNSEMQSDTINWLKLKLPRKTRVNLRPLSSENGILVARVIPIGSAYDISKEMIEKGFAVNTCESKS